MRKFFVKCKSHIRNGQKKSIFYSLLHWVWKKVKNDVEVKKWEKESKWHIVRFWTCVIFYIYSSETLIFYHSSGREREKTQSVEERCSQFHSHAKNIHLNFSFTIFFFFWKEKREWKEKCSRLHHIKGGKRRWMREKNIKSCQLPGFFSLLFFSYVHRQIDTSPAYSKNCSSGSSFRM